MGAIVLIVVIFLATRGNKNASLTDSENKNIATTTKPKKSKTTPAPDKTVLTIWQPIDEPDNFAEIIAEFQNTNPDIALNWEVKSINEYERVSTNALSAQKGPDIWVIPNTWIPRHQDKIVPAPEYVFSGEKDKIPNVDYFSSQFVPIISSEAVIDGKVAGVPLFVDTLALYYNRSIFKDVIKEINQNDEPDEQLLDLLSSGPANWNDVMTLVKIITQKDNENITRSAIALGASENISHSEDILGALMLQNKTQIISPDHQTATFNLPQDKNTGESYSPGKNAFEFFLSFADKTKDNYTWNSSFENSQKAFLNGKVAMIIDYQYLGKVLEKYDPNLDFKTIALPQVYAIGDATQEPTPVDFATYYVMTVTKNSQKQDAAWKFLSYMVSRGGIRSYDAATGRSKPFKIDEIPANLTERASSSNPFKFQPMTAVGWYRSKETVKANLIWKNMITNAATGAMDSQKALDLGAKLLTDLLRSTE